MDLLSEAHHPYARRAQAHLAKLFEGVAELSLRRLDGRLPGEFASFRLWATSHPEIAPLLGHGRRELGGIAQPSLPERLRVRDVAPDGRDEQPAPPRGFGVMDA